MKKLVFTLAFGLFFVSFTHAQTAKVETAETKQLVEVVSSSKVKIACEPGCTKACCADKTAKSEYKDKAACKDKAASCKGKDASECKGKTADLKAKASCDGKRPSSCDDKRPSCDSKKS